VVQLKFFRFLSILNIDKPKSSKVDDIVPFGLLLSQFGLAQKFEDIPEQRGFDLVVNKYPCGIQKLLYGHFDVHDPLAVRI
jgi:hypothetical protein